MFRFPFSFIPSLSLLSLVLLSSVCHAAASGAFVAVYNSGRAQVHETRVVNLPEGPAAVVFTDVPATLDATSIRAAAQGMTVRDVQYSYTAITTKGLLDEYVGKELTVILPDPADANARILRKARLISNVDRPVFAMGKEVYVGSYDALLLPEMPKGFDTEPTLTLTSDSSAKGRKNVSLSYLMSGLNWRADYTITVDTSGALASIDAWATITNSANYPFKGADVRLVAGDVQRVDGASPKLARSNRYMTMEAAMDAVPAPAMEESFSEYHVYSFDRYISLPANGSKQVSLFSAARVPVVQKLTSRFHAGSGQRSGTTKQGVESTLTFRNMEESSLGKPMPAGLVRVFMPTSDNNHLLSGEARIGHTGKGGEVKLALGRSFDVTVERTQTSYTKVGKNAYEIGWAVTVKNGRDEARSITLRDSFPGQWAIVTADAKYTKVDSGSIEFTLNDLPPTGSTAGKVIKYVVRIEY